VKGILDIGLMLAGFFGDSFLNLFFFQTSFVDLLLSKQKFVNLTFLLGLQIGKGLNPYRMTIKQTIDGSLAFNTSSSCASNLFRLTTGFTHQANKFLLIPSSS